MNKSRFIKTLFAFVILTICSLTHSMYQNNAHGSTNGGPVAYTGSPSNGRTCGTNGGCHNTGTAPFLAGLITSNIPATGYIPGQTYLFTVNPVVVGAPTVVSKVGFSISPQTQGGVLVGILTAGTGSKLVGSGAYVTHTGTLMNSTSRTFSWTAPAISTPSVTFYGAFNYSNAQNNSSGDQIRTTTITLNQDVTTDIQSIDKPSINVSVFAVLKSLKVELEMNVPNQITLSVMDVKGKNVCSTQKYDVQTGKNEIVLDLLHLSKGFYMVNILSDDFLPISRKILID